MCPPREGSRPCEPGSAQPARITLAVCGQTLLAEGGEIALPATSSSSFPVPAVTVTLGVRLRLGGINFGQVSIFPDAGQPEELSLLVVFQKRPRGWEVLGCGGVDEAPLQKPPGVRVGQEEPRGGGERGRGCPAGVQASVPSS